MSVIKNPIPGSSFKTEISTALVRPTFSSMAVSNGIMTITTTGAHGLTTANAITFSAGIPTSYNGTAFQVLSVPTSTTFTIATSLGAVTTGTTLVIIPFYYPAPGYWYVALGANASIEYNPTNDGFPNISPDNTTVFAGTWRAANAVSTTTSKYMDGYGMRLTFTANAGTTTLSLVE